MMTNHISTYQGSTKVDKFKHSKYWYYDIGSKKVFGFWIYLMSDCVLFCCLFATYIVLMNNTAGGPTSKDIFKIPLILAETILLLLSSFTYGIASTHIPNKNRVISWLLLTWLFGICFIGMEIYEFHHLIKKGFTPNQSAFLSSFFATVSAHSLHVVSGLIWMIVLMFQIYYRGLTTTNRIRIICLSLFWHFLDIVWICVFSLIYLIGII